MQKRVLVSIVISQFACTSVWFAANAVMPELVNTFGISENSLSFFTSIIQFGFIIGTLFLAIYGVADRFKPSIVFMICALLSGLSNLALLLPFNNFISISVFRFITGICLAGVYPIGIKIASDYFKNGLGIALGYLVGTLVLGTAIPHLFNYIALENSLKTVIYLTSGLSTAGALLVGLSISEGPFAVSSAKFNPKEIPKLIKTKSLRKSALGYFGHMWELYTFWAFTPTFIKLYNQMNHTDLNISLWSFITIAIGFFSCIYGGYLANQYSSRIIARYSLLGSLICGILFPFSLFAPSVIFIFILLLWGIFVIADSPQLSTLVAQSAPAVYKGTAITLVNCIGFSITILSIQLLNSLINKYDSLFIYYVLASGPLFGFFILKLKNK